MAKKFINDILSKLKGDKDSEVAEDNYNQACLAIKSEMMNTEVELHDLKEALKDATKQLERAKKPLTAIPKTDHGRVSYIQSLVDAERAVRDVEIKISNTEKWAEQLKKYQTEFEQEDTAQ